MVQRAAPDVLLVGERVDQQELRHQRARDGPCELQQDVDDCVVRPDLAQDRQRDGDGRVEVRAGDASERLHEHEQHEEVNEADDDPVGAGALGVTKRVTASVIEKTSTNVPMNSATYAAGRRCST